MNERCPHCHRLLQVREADTFRNAPERDREAEMAKQAKHKRALNVEVVRDEEGGPTRMRFSRPLPEIIPDPD